MSGASTCRDVAYDFGRLAPEGLRSRAPVAEKLGRPACWPQLAGQRILIVGGEDLFLRLPFLRRLKDAGLDVVAAGTGRAEPFQRQDVAYASYAMIRGVNPLCDLRTVRQLGQICRRFRPTIVHAFDTKPSIYAIWAAKRAGVPVRIRTLTGRGSVFVNKSAHLRPLAWVLGRMHQHASRLAHLTAFYNRDDCEFARKHWRLATEHAIVVPGSGIDPEYFLGQVPPAQEQEKLRHMLSSNGGPVVLMISRLLREKGVLEYLQAAQLVRRQFPAVNFFLVGGIEPDGKHTLAESELTAYHEDVRWLGRRDDVPALLSATDLFVLPTYYGEGIPRVLLEAGICARAVITTKVPGCTDVIVHGENGWLVPPRDPQSLAAAILHLLADEKLRHRLGARLAQDVKANFSLDRVVEVWLGIYARLLSQIKLSGNK